MIALTTNKALVKQLINQQTRIAYLENQLTQKDIIIARQLEAINELEDRNDNNLKIAQRLQLDKVRPKNEVTDFTKLLKNIDDKLDLVAIPPRKFGKDR